MPQQRSRPTTQACALTGDHSFCGTTPNQLSHVGQSEALFYTPDLSHFLPISKWITVLMLVNILSTMFVFPLHMCICIFKCVMFLKFAQMLLHVICQWFQTDTDDRARDLKRRRTETVGCRVRSIFKKVRQQSQWHQADLWREGSLPLLRLRNGLKTQASEMEVESKLELLN